MERKDRYVTKITRIVTDGVELSPEELPQYRLVKKEKLKSTYGKHNTTINWVYIYEPSRQLTFNFDDTGNGTEGTANSISRP